MGDLKFDWTRVNLDYYGNPRYVVHFLEIMPKSIEEESTVYDRYEKTVKFANTLGGKKFHNKQYGGGIVFQSYNLSSTEEFIIKSIKEYDEKRGMNKNG